MALPVARRHYVKVREGGRIFSRAVIIAVAVNEDGKREVRGIATGSSEAKTFWALSLRSLADRGLQGREAGDRR